MHARAHTHTHALCSVKLVNQTFTTFRKWKQRSVVELWLQSQALSTQHTSMHSTILCFWIFKYLIREFPTVFFLFLCTKLWNPASMFVLAETECWVVSDAHYYRQQMAGRCPVNSNKTQQSVLHLDKTPVKHSGGRKWASWTVCAPDAPCCTLSYALIHTQSQQSVPIFSDRLPDLRTGCILEDLLKTVDTQSFSM